MFRRLLLRCLTPLRLLFIYIFNSKQHRMLAAGYYRLLVLAFRVHKFNIEA